MKLIFMGTPDFTIPILEAIKSAGHDIALIVTRQDKPVGRKQILTPPPAKKWADENDIEVYQPLSLRNKSSYDKLKSVGADIFVVAAYGRILPKEILDIPHYGCINVHASLLPKYRGAAPIQWAILNGDEVTGVTIMKMDEGLDTGDILLQKEIPISPTETGGGLFDKLAALGGEALIEALPLIESNSITPIKQDESRASEVCRISRDMGRIDFNDPAIDISNKIRAFTPWPKCYATFKGKVLSFIKAEAITDIEMVLVGDAKSEWFKAAPGTVVYVNDKKWIIRTGDGFISPLVVLESSKKQMSADDYLRGHKIEAGDVFE